MGYHMQAEFDDACATKIASQLQNRVLIGDQGAKPDRSIESSSTGDLTRTPRRAANITVLEEWLHQTGPDFDIIIDDGMHHNELLLRINVVIFMLSLSRRPHDPPAAEQPLHLVARVEAWGDLCYGRHADLKNEESLECALRKYVSPLSAHEVRSLLGLCSSWMIPPARQLMHL